MFQARAEIAKRPEGTVAYGDRLHTGIQCRRIKSGWVLIVHSPQILKDDGMRKIRFNRPILDLFIEIPFFRVRTDLMVKRLEMNHFEYVRLSIHLWVGKWWTFDFSLYKNRMW